MWRLRKIFHLNSFCKVSQWITILLYNKITEITIDILKRVQNLVLYSAVLIENLIFINKLFRIFVTYLLTYRWSINKFYSDKNYTRTSIYTGGLSR